jgi:CBS domain-containing protein
MTMTVGQLMSRSIRTCRPDNTLNAAAQIMWEEDCGCVPVVQEDGEERPRLVGIVTDRDICMAAYTQGKPLASIPVASVMERDLATCVAADPINVALNVLRTRRLHRLPVVDHDAELVGLVSLADIARESKHPARKSAQQSVTAESVGDTVAIICQARGGSREVVAAP